MTDKVQKIREDVERLCNAGLHNSTISKKDVLNTILAVVNDFKREPVSKELEEACEKFRWNIEESCYQNDNGTYTYSSDNIEEAFKAGAKWQKENLWKSADDDLEEAADEWDESLYRSDAFKAGAKWQKAKDREIIETARKEMIEKVCEYIASNMRCDGYTLQTKSKFIKDLKQAINHE